MKNYLIYPCKAMRITQSYTGTTSHLPYSTGSPKDYPWDEGCSGTGRDYFYCPCDEMKIKRIYGVGTSGTNALWLESTSKVYFADGTSGYFTLLIIHPNDDDLRKLKVGQIFERKDRICREGNDGTASYHFHFSAGKGKVKDNGWKLNSKGKYVLTTSAGTERPQDLFFIDKDFTKVVSDKDLKFKTLPEYKTGTYVVNTAALNTRSGPGTKYAVKSVLFKGKKITVEKVSGDWGRYYSGRWVNLDHCKKV